MGLCLKSLRVLSAYSDKTQRWVSTGAGLHSYVHKNHLETLSKHRSVGGGERLESESVDLGWGQELGF